MQRTINFVSDTFSNTRSELHQSFENSLGLIFTADLMI